MTEKKTEEWALTTILKSAKTLLIFMESVNVLEISDYIKDLKEAVQILEQPSSDSAQERLGKLDGIVVEVNESQYNTLAPYLDKTPVASVDPLTDSSPLYYGFPNVSGTIVLYLNENDWEWDRPEDFREESPEIKAKYHEVSYEELLDYLIKHYS